MSWEPPSWSIKLQLCSGDPLFGKFRSISRKKQKWPLFFFLLFDSKSPTHILLSFTVQFSQNMTPVALSWVPDNFMQISCHTPFCSIVAAIWGTILREFDANEENVVGSRALGAYKHLHNQRSHTAPQGTLPSKVKMWRNHNKACYKLYIEALAEVKCKKIQNNARLKKSPQHNFQKFVWPPCLAIFCLALQMPQLWEEQKRTMRCNFGTNFCKTLGRKVR